METVQEVTQVDTTSETPVTSKKPRATKVRDVLKLQTMTIGNMNLDVAMIGDEPWIYAPSLARKLEYRAATDMLRDIPDNERASYFVQTDGGTQQANFLSEPGFYRLVMRSQSDMAVPIKGWIFQVVPPAIRETVLCKLQQDDRQLDVSFGYSIDHWEWLKLHPDMLDLLPLAAAGYDCDEITRMLNYNTKNGITARHQIDKLKELGFLPNVIEPRAKQLERRILAERAAATPAVALK